MGRSYTCSPRGHEIVWHRRRGSAWALPFTELDRALLNYFRTSVVRGAQCPACRRPDANRRRRAKRSHAARVNKVYGDPSPMASPTSTRAPPRSPDLGVGAWGHRLDRRGGTSRATLVVFADNGDTWDLYENLHDVRDAVQRSRDSRACAPKKALRGAGLRRPLSTPPSCSGGQGGRAEGSLWIRRTVISP